MGEDTTGKLLSVAIGNNIVALEQNEIPGYKIMRAIGFGGMGTVWMALQNSLKRIIAIKVISEETTFNVCERLMQEAQALAQLNHPNIVQIYDIGQVNKKTYYSMEYIDGWDLETLIKNNGLFHPREGVYIIHRMALALHEMHSKNFVHRDVKPSNIMVSKDHRIKITDFGLAKNTKEDIDITQKGMIVGSPSYIAPEQISNQDCDHRADIYSLGATFYTLLTGKRPFEGNSPIEVFTKVIQGGYTPIQSINPKIPNSINRIIFKLMSLNPDERYQSAKALISELKEIYYELPDDSKTNIVVPDDELGFLDTSSYHITKSQAIQKMKTNIYMETSNKVFQVCSSGSYFPMQTEIYTTIPKIRTKFWELKIVAECIHTAKRFNITEFKVFLPPQIFDLGISFQIYEDGAYKCEIFEKKTKKKIPFVSKGQNKIF